MHSTPVTSTKATDLDVTADLAGTYLRKEEIQESGPRRFTIADAERVVFEARDGKPAKPKIVLTFATDPVRKMSLNDTNLDTVKSEWGTKAVAWLGRTIEVFYDPDVRFQGKRT